MVYEVGRGRESLFGSLSVSYMEQIMGMVCLGRRGGKKRDGEFVLYIVWRIGESGVSGKSWVEVGSGGGGRGVRRGGSMNRVVLHFRCGW